MTREERIEAEIGRLERAIRDDDDRVHAHATISEFHSAAAQSIRARQSHCRALIDCLRAELLPGVQPIRALLPQVRQDGGGGEERRAAAR